VHQPHYSKRCHPDSPIATSSHQKPRHLTKSHVIPDSDRGSSWATANAFSVGLLTSDVRRQTQLWSATKPEVYGSSIELRMTDWERWGWHHSTSSSSTFKTTSSPAPIGDPDERLRMLLTSVFWHQTSDATMKCYKARGFWTLNQVEEDGAGIEDDGAAVRRGWIKFRTSAD